VDCSHIVVLIEARERNKGTDLRPWDKSKNETDPSSLALASFKKRAKLRPQTRVPTSTRDSGDGSYIQTAKFALLVLAVVFLTRRSSKHQSPMIDKKTAEEI
jgi:hypothetical protein